jgi:predicted RNA binding protein YcfA (HicA-like mRNA interferase family)
MTFIELEKMLKRDGWYYYDSVGSHIQYKHRIKPRKSNNTKT